MHNTILSNAIWLTIGTIVSKILGFGREWILAYKYGAGTISDAFALTNSIPTTIFVSLATAISINYIPICSECEDNDQRNYFTSNIMWVSSLIMVLGLAIIELFCSTIIFCFAPGIDAITRMYAQKMLRIVIFSIFPIIYTSIFQGYSQINGGFKMTSVYGVITNIIIIISIILSNERTFFLLSIGYVLGYMVGMFICYVEAKNNGFIIKLWMSFKDPRIKKIVLLTLPLMVEDVSASLSLVADKVLGSFLESGTISALGYASTLGNIASTMIASAIITATYPVFAKLITSGKIIEFSDEMKKYGIIIAVLLSPISAFMTIYAREIVGVVFNHGAFELHSINVVSESLACYSIGIIPCGIQSYYVRAFYSMQNTKTPVIIKVSSLLSNIILNIVLVRYIKHMGIALSTSVSYLVAMVMLSLLFEKKYKLKVSRKINTAIIRSCIISFCFCIIIKFLSTMLIQNELIRILVSGVVFLLLYVVMSLLLMDEELKRYYFLELKRLGK